MKNYNNKTKVYITLDDGLDFRGIAKAMSEKNYEMNHATVRNVLMSAMFKLIRHITDEIGEELTDEELIGILKNQNLHNSLQDVLHAGYAELNSRTANTNEQQQQHSIE